MAPCLVAARMAGDRAVHPGAASVMTLVVMMGFGGCRRRCRGERNGGDCKQIADRTSMHFTVLVLLLIDSPSERISSVGAGETPVKSDDSVTMMRQ